MQNILHIFKLDNMLNRKSKSKVINTLSLICSGFLCVLFSIIFSFFILKAFDGLEQELNVVGCLSLIVAIIQIVLFLYTITNQQKSVFLYRNKEILAYLPIKKWQIYLAKILRCLINVCVLNLLVSLPSFAIFGLAFNLGKAFYLLMIPASLLLPLLPFALANLLLLPLMWLQNVLKNLAVLKLIINIILTIIGFYLYSEIIFVLAKLIFLTSSGASSVLYDIHVIFTINSLPSTMLANIMMQQHQFTALFVILSVILPCFTILFGCLTYKNIFNTALVQKTVAKTIKTKNKERSAFMAYFVNEFKDLFRSATYSYTYIGMAVAMPIMVLLCNKFIVEFAVESVGKQIIFGTTLLVVLIFVAIISSPTASFISKEGDNFWLLKTNPTGIKLPLFAKSLVGIIIIFASLVATFVVLTAFNFLSFGYGLLILALACIFVVGLVALGLLLNLINPNLFYSNKENNNNIIAHMLVGVAIAVVMGCVAIVLNFTISFAIVALICLAIVVVFSGLSVVLLLALNKKLYLKMEV